MKRLFGYIVLILFLVVSVDALAQRERIRNWNFYKNVGLSVQWKDKSAWNEFNFDRNEIDKADLEASNGRSLRCYVSKSFFGKDAYGIGQYGGRAQSVFPCPEPGTVYTFSARARVKGELVDEGPGEVALYFYNDKEEIVSNPILYFSGTSYEVQSQTITVPDDAVWSRVWVRKDGKVDFYTDWVSLKATIDDTPGAVTNFRATDIGATKVLLEWDPVPGASGYHIDRKRSEEDNSKWYPMFITNDKGQRSSFLDSRDSFYRQLESGVQFDYRIIAVGDYGVSDTTYMSVTTATFASSPGNTTYFIDATNGDDAAAGTSEATAWKNFMNLDRLELAPGDSVLLKKGEYWNESLILHGDGAAGNEIVVAPYGTEQERPVINVEAEAHAAVRLIDVSYYRVQDLELSNYHPQFREFYKYGVEAGTWRNTSVTGLHFDNLFINKIRGSGVRGGNGGFIDNGQMTGGIRLGTDIRFADPEGRMIYDVSITNCVLNEIEQHGMHLGNIDGITIMNNRVRRGGYTGMLTRRLYNGIVANNYFIEGGYYMTCDDNAGVGMYGGDNMLFENNVIYKTYNQASGQSFNMDGCDNYIVQYNLFKDSESGCFVLNHAADGNIFRYNISEGFNDQWLRNLGGINTQVYNNVAYIKASNHSSTVGFFVRNGTTHSTIPTPTNNTQVYNNIFIREVSDLVETADLISEDPATVNSNFSHNVYYGNFSDLVEEDSNAFFVDPLFVNPGSAYVDTTNYTINVDGYQLQDTSPYIMAGMIITENGGRDFWGNELFDNYPPSLGAHQSPVVTAIEEENLKPAQLMQNYPNPFYSGTSIQYYVPANGMGNSVYNKKQVFLHIYDIQGQLVNTLVNESQESGLHTVQWNRKDHMGKVANRGIYFYSITIGDYTNTRKMILSY
ncbi:MAG: T9SS type A sorting domain-containing protein [Bacteroidota bacterium]